MIQAIDKITDIVADKTSQEISEDSVLQDALFWNFSVLGEAAAKLPEEFRREHGQVGWRRPIDLRNRLIHGYWSIDLALLVVTAQDDLPEFRQSLLKVQEIL